MPLEPLLREYTYLQLLRVHSVPLITKRPQACFEILLRQLAQFAEAQGELGVWRWAIENTDQDFMNRPIDGLVEATRDALLATVDANPDEGPDLVLSLLRSEHSTVRRLGLHALTERPQVLSFVSADLLPSVENVDSYHWHEFMRLVAERFEDLPDATKGSIHDFLKGAGESAENSDPTAHYRVERRRWITVNLVPESQLTAEERRLKLTLNAVRGLPEHPLFLAWFSGMQALTSPATPAQLKAIYSEQGPDGLLSVLREPAGHFSFQFPHDVELIWDTLGELTREQPSEMLNLATSLLPSDFPEAAPFIWGYKEALRANRDFSRAPLYALFGRVLNSDADARSLHSFSEFIKELAGQLTFVLENEELDRLLEFATAVLERTATPLEAVGRIEEETDIATHHINTAPGFAADVIVSVVFRRALALSTAEETRTLFPERSREDPTAFALLNRGVSGGWGGVELRHAIGKRLRLIVWAGPGWLDRRLDQLLPWDFEAEAGVGAWRAFWTGHFIADRLSDRVLVALKDRYRMLVNEAGDLESRLLKKAFAIPDREALADHLMVGWLRGYEGFGRDGLFGTFMAEVEDSMRAHVVRRLVGELLEARRSSDETWRRRVLIELDALWVDRTHALRNEPDKGQLELDAFSYWLQGYDAELSQIRDRVELIAERSATQSSPDLLLEYLERAADTDPAGATEIVNLVVRQSIDTHEFFWVAGQRLPGLIEKLWRTADTTANRSALRALVSLLLERRGVDLRPMISAG